MSIEKMLKNFLKICLDEIKIHNQEYKYSTDKDLIESIEKLLNKEKNLDELIKETSPDLLYKSNPGDGHRTHKEAAQQPAPPRHGGEYESNKEALLALLERISEITYKDLEKNHSEDVLFSNCVEELGEYAAAKTIERGIKKKELKENSLVESVDVIICALSLFFLSGGNIDKLIKIGQTKLDKWEKRL